MSPRGRGLAGRSHAAIGHTADVGVRARAPEPAGLLEEGATALAQLMADVPDNPPSPTTVPVEVRGDDLAALTYGWLNELVGLADARGEALVGATVDDLRAVDGAWVAHGRAAFVAYDRQVQPRTQVKAATFHRLRVEEAGDGWSLEAYFDV